MPTVSKRTKRTAETVAVNGFTLPALKKGEHYAGVILGKDGAHGDHVILLPGEADSGTWEQAKKWAAKAGGELPTRREQSLLYANLKEHFQSAWYWSCEQPASDSDYAWMQLFGYGRQDYDRKSSYGRARAVRRVPLVIQ